MLVLYVKSNIVQNMVEDPNPPPAYPLTQLADGTYLVPTTNTNIAVGDAFDIAAYNLAQQLATANTALTSGLSEVGRLIRAIAGVVVDEINVFRQWIVGVGTVAWDPPNLANAAGATSAGITVAGAAFGDFVDVAAPYSLSGLTVTGYVSAANTVVIRTHNGTGGQVNLGSGTWAVTVRRMGQLLPDRTLAQAKAAVGAKVDAGV